MTRPKKILLTIGGVLLVGLLFTAFILPPMVRTELEKRVSAATDRRFTVSALAINPLTWSAELRGASLSEKGGTGVFVSFSSLKLRVSPTSLWRLAPVVSSITLSSPYVHLARTGKNAYNFTDILEKQPKKKEKAAPARFSLNNIVIKGGRIEFDDLAMSQPARHKIEQLAVQVPFISNIPYFADRYVDPKLYAVVNGAPFDFSGKLKPFAKGMEAVISIHLKELDIPFYAAYFPKELPVRVDKGKLSTTLEVTHRLEHGNSPDINISGKVRLELLALSGKGGAPLVSWNFLDLDIAKAGIMTGSYDLSRVAVGGPELSLTRSSGGAWNFTELFPKKTENKEEPAEIKAAKKEKKQSVSVQSLSIEKGIVRFRDDLPRGGFAAEVRDFSFGMDNFATFGERPASYRFSFNTGRGEKGSSSGSLALDPLNVSSRLDLSELVLEAYYPYLATVLKETVRGRADFSTDLAFNSDTGLILDQAMLKVRKLQVPFGSVDGVRIPQVSGEGGSLRLKDRSFNLERLTVSGGKVDLSRDEAGRLSTGLLLESSHPSRGAAASSGDKSSAPFRWNIGKVAVNGLDVSFTDGTREEKPRFELRKLTVSALSIAGPVFGRIPFTVAAGYGSQGAISAKGVIVPKPFQLKADCILKGIPLLDADPYLPESVNVILADGTLDAKLALALSGEGKSLAGSYSGAIGIRDFYTLDEEESEDLLKWESLHLEGIQGTLQPFTLAMSEVTLQKYYARVIINKNGKINLQELYTPPRPVSEPGLGMAAPATPPTTAKPVPAKGNIRIDSVTLQEGVLNFTDHHLNREFSTTMLNLGGRISGLSSDTGGAADVDLRGNLENHSPLTIVGKINPLKGDLFLDMLINFSDIELSPMTPYSGTFLGYAIDKGKLSLTLRYKVDQKKLSAENKVFMDQFTFGESVDSPKATKLPVRLAVALLKDRNGEIHLDLPLAGRTDDPKFSVWGVIGQMLKNLLVKVATSPLSLLQSAFGGSEDFNSVPFSHGSSRLSTEEEAKLGKLATALNERPGLRLEVAGFVDRERDGEGYRRELLSRKMKTEKFLALVKEKHESAGLTPEKIVIPPEEESRWLKAVYEKEKFPRPRTVIGTLKTLPDQEMRKLILANSVVGDEQFRALARERSKTVTDYLIRVGKLSQERLFEKSGDIFTPPAKEGSPSGRVEFGVVVK